MHLQKDESPSEFILKTNKKPFGDSNSKNTTNVNSVNRNRPTNNIPMYIIPSNINRPQSNILDIVRTFYDTVPVIPTRLQIDTSTRTCLFSQIENPINLSCPITLDRFNQQSNVTQILNCCHIFNSTSIESWFQTSVRCPVCRYDIRDTINTPSTSPSINSSSPPHPPSQNNYARINSASANRQYIITPTTSLTDLTETILEQLFNL